MIEHQHKDKLLRTARLIATLYLVSTAIFAALAFILPPRLEEPVQYEPAIVHMLTLILGIMAVVGIILGFVLPLRIISSSKQLSTPSQKFFLTTVLGCALFETPALYGLILIVIGASVPVALGFMIVSAGFMLYTFPTEEKIADFLSTFPQ